jgi:phosphatidylserine/phosphatidylglycerophosphate/cardiolipin synthase-like enzyme
LDRVTKQLPAPLEDPNPCGTKAVQVLRTYPARRPRYPFAPEGERSVALGFQKAIERARSLIYIEDQYFWSEHIASLLARALRRHPQLQLIVVVPRFPDKDGRISGPPSRLAQQRAMDIVQAAGGNRVGIYSLNNDKGAPVYVHAKVCVIDDVWATVGSDNLNRRSWTHDSELSCAIIDSEIDERIPADPGGLGDRSRKFARELRMNLWAEHLACSPDAPELLDIEHATETWNRHAIALTQPDSEHMDGCVPLIQVHTVETVSPKNRAWAGLVYRFIFDPDGRPLYHRLRHKY